MNKNTLWIGGSVLVAVFIIGGAIVVRSRLNRPTPASKVTPPPAQKQLTAEQLASFDGKNSHECYAAVDGKVYRIEQGRLWQNGEHTTSEGQAMCGKDLSQVISKSPHGKSKLEALDVVGTLQP